jgi:hypothetical protein
MDRGIINYLYSIFAICGAKVHFIPQAGNTQISVFLECRAIRADGSVKKTWELQE